MPNKTKTKQKLPCTIKNEDGTVTVKLLEPIDYGEDRFESFTFKRPKAKHLKKMNLQNLQMEDILLLAGKLAAQPPSVLDELGMDDLFAVAGVIESFLPDGETIGKIA